MVIAFKACLWTWLSSRRGGGTITSKNEVVDLLVLSAQNTWGCAQVCF